MHLKLPLHRLASLVAAVRERGERLAIAGLIAVAVALLVLGKADVQLVRVAGDRIDDALVPVVTLLKQPIALTRDLAGGVGAILAVHEENARLRAENRRLRAWQNEAIRLRVQNRSLRDMLAMPLEEPATRRTTARIVADSASSFVHTRLLDAGRDAGVRRGMAVANPSGLVGRVIAVGERSARVLLLTDFNSKVPVIVERSGDQALLEGDNSGEPKLRFLPLNPNFAIGDRVLTSGKGGMLPPGLPVGEIRRIDDATAAVDPYVDWQRLDYVSVLLYEPTPSPGEAPSEDDDRNIVRPLTTAADTG